MSLLAPLIKPLQIVINRYVALDPEAPKQLAAMQGNVVELHFSLLNQSVFIFISADGLDFSDDYNKPADTKISGSPIALSMMGLQENSAASLFSGDVLIQGDIELGNQFQQFLNNIEVDWEEPLSQLTGDVVANGLGDMLRNVHQWAQQSSKTSALDVAEYFREEQHMLPSTFEVERFKKEVDELRLSTDRLEANVQRLIAKKQKKTGVLDKDTTW